MFDEATAIDKIEVLVEIGVIQVRERTEVSKDGVVVSTSYRRWVVTRDSDLSLEPESVAKVARAVFL